MQRVIDNGSLPNKSRKKNEEKININIFLAHNVPELELGSDSESGVKPPMGKTVCAINKYKFQLCFAFPETSFCLC